MSDVLLQVHDLSKSLTSASGQELLVNTGIDLSLRTGEFVSIVGPSGGGKTTLLRTLSGLSRPDTGTVTHRGAPVEGVPAWMSIVFQDYTKTLFPWLTVERNVRLAIRDAPRAEAARRVEQALDRMGLAGFADRYPWELSGGMQQRVALARAMICEPEVLFLDEPFASVDALTRAKLEDTVLRLWEQAGMAVLLVTHDIGEAVYLSDRVLVLSARPSTIIGEVEIDLPRPRGQATTRALPRFHELHAAVLAGVENPEPHPVGGR
jgi:NitT/TauT family transport system ATP-binding protein